MHMGSLCQNFDGTVDLWLHHRPATGDTSKRPALYVTYQP
jgi:hypothetical protein